MSISEALRERVWQTFNHRCAYCLSAQKYLMHVLEIDHIIPLAKGGSDEEDNLCLACRPCNNRKNVQTHMIDNESGQITPLFNPREDRWSDHFEWSEDGLRLIGITPKGRATVKALKMNSEFATTTRMNWASVGWHPPD